MDGEKKHKKIWIPIVISIIAVAASAAVIVFFIIRPTWIDKLLPQTQSLVAEGVIIPWNPGGTADIVTRSLINQAAPGITIQNIHGANGTLGLQKVYDAPHDGKTLLGTNMSAFLTAQMMGFTDTSYNEWEIWLAAFSPSIIAVKEGSPYNTLGDLLTALNDNPGKLICANAGNGTLSFVAAYLFANGTGMDFEHKDYSGSNPAINAVSIGEADFILALSTELNSVLRSNELRALAVFSDNELILDGLSRNIAPITEEIPMLKELVPFGEAYGLLVPKGTPSNMLNSYDKQFNEARVSETFETFVLEKGLLRINYDRKTSMEYANKLVSIISWTLYDTNCVNISPDTLGIPRP